MEEYIDGETSPFLREDFLKSAHKKSRVHAAALHLSASYNSQPMSSAQGIPVTLFLQASNLHSMLLEVSPSSIPWPPPQNPLHP